MDQITTIIAQELGKPAAHVQAVIELIDQGN